MINRWLFSTNAKDIAILYFVIAIFSAMIGSSMSLIIRLELAAPGNQILQGHNQIFNVIVAGHAIAMIFFFVMPALIGGFGKNGHLYLKLKKCFSIYHNNDLNSYLAGLFEGNGTIWVPKENEKFTPVISFVFKKEDKPLVLFLINKLKIGKLIENENKNYIFWNIKKIEDVYLFLFNTNGYYRTPKYEGILKAIHWINSYKNQINKPIAGLDIYNYQRKLNILNKIDNLDTKPLDESNLSSNAWLTGFTDADGNFSISLDLNSKNRKPRVKLSYNLEIKQNYHKLNNLGINISYSEIMLNIACLFNSNLYSRKRRLSFKNSNEKYYYSFIVSVNSMINLKLVTEYFQKYPLLSSKRLNFEDWLSLYKLIELKNNSSSHPECVKLGIELQKNFNSTRTKYTWDHLDIN